MLLPQQNLSNNIRWYCHIYIYIVYRVCLSIGYPKNQWSIMIFPIQWPHFNTFHRIYTISRSKSPPIIISPWISSWFGSENYHIFHMISTYFHHGDPHILGPYKIHHGTTSSGERSISGRSDGSDSSDPEFVRKPGNFDGKMPGKIWEKICQIMNRITLIWV